MLALRRVLLGSLLLFGASTLATRAQADVPGPKPRCSVEGSGCQECWQPYGGSPEASAQFEACAEPLRKQGLAEGCRHRQGAGDSVYFCPAGVKPEIKTVGGGCGACMSGAANEDAHVTGALVAAALAALVIARRRRAPSARRGR